MIAAPVAIATPVRRIGTAAWTVSAVLHLLAVGTTGWFVARAAASAPVAVRELGVMVVSDDAELPLIELPTMVSLSTVAAPSPVTEDAIPPTPGGGEPVPRPDAARRGRGGDAAAVTPALNLADRDDAISLSKQMQTHLDRSQVQRIESAKQRASHDDRRATLQPMELTFIVSGKGHTAERRPLAETDPSAGKRASALAGVRGGQLGADPLPAGEGESPRDPGTTTRGGTVAAPGAGLLHGARGADHRASADAMFARPDVTEARPAVPANVAGKPKDTTDSKQEVAATEEALQHASTAGGKEGVGLGGAKAEGAPGSGGDVGAGSKSRPLGPGGGAPPDLEADARLTDYRRQVKAKIHPLWANAFPKWAALEQRQGTAIIGFTILADGRVTAVFVSRKSNIPEFDENVRQAVLRAAPFPPIPATLKAPMVWSLAFDSPNPAVR